MAFMAAPVWVKSEEQEAAIELVHGASKGKALLRGCCLAAWEHGYSASRVGDSHRMPF